MELSFSEKQLCKVLESYYKEQEDINGKVTISVTDGYVGYGMAEKIDCLVKMEIKGELDLSTMKVPLKQEITQEQLRNAINYFLAKTNNTIESFRINKGMLTKTIGYGMAERDIKVPYFEGVIVTTKNKIKKIGGM